jgi:hypothetical protein
MPFHSWINFTRESSSDMTPEKNVRDIEKRLSERPGESHFEEQNLEQENVKEILHDVLNELYYSKGKKETRNSNHGR